MEDFEEFVEFVEVIEAEPDQIIPYPYHRIPKKYLRDFEDPFDRFSEDAFKRRYRFSKNSVQHKIFPLIADELAKVNQRGLPIHPMVQLLLNLRYYATGNYQTVTADLRGISQPTVCRSVKKLSQVIARYTRDYCKFGDNIQRTIQKFSNIAHFPGISCVIDGTHVLISNPGGEIGEVFRNRKRQFSINVQVACDPGMQIVDIVARYPGSMHDNTIFERSGLRLKYENNEIAGKILGDNGYACKSYLLTPVLNPTTRPERRYNTAHKTTRNIIERCFGIWKRRFPCLKRGISTKVETAVQIICATAVLHNIRRDEDIIEGEEDDNDNEIEIFVQDDDNALALRRAFIITHFN